MVNRKGFTVVELLIAFAVIGFLLIILVAVPNALRQTRNGSRVQDVNALASLVRERQAISQTGALPASCNNTQAGCFIRDIDLAHYDNTSDVETYITYFRNTSRLNELSPQLDIEDEEVTAKVYIHTFAICDGNRLSAEQASAGSVVIQYAVETVTGVALLCKNI
jgi:type II secretory pathway pseudopilin PulG